MVRRNVLFYFGKILPKKLNFNNYIHYALNIYEGYNNPTL